MEDRFRKRLRAERERREWSQSHMAQLLSDKGIPMMHATTVAKIEAGDRAVRIDEAAAIADLFDVSLDSLLGRKSALSTDLSYTVSAMQAAAKRSTWDINVIANAIRETFAEVLEFEFEGRDAVECEFKRAFDAFDVAMDALWKIGEFKLSDETVGRIRDDLIEQRANEKVRMVFQAIEDRLKGD